ncbi:pirin family protein [Dokdonella koreensis]|uniref:Pirin n=1 Tax=Dokdonella koreensis DS-123 TaxID=1300342 RepID=A0A160DXC2_9GAMM|nr:Pirin [Dokdonella koreensis DS-123]
MSDDFLTIEPRIHDVGHLEVARFLPHMKCRHLGPFVFFDHIGPAAMPAGVGMDVRPHPHIGLATVTYLFEGAIEHRDSLGFDQVIRPGDVNWMTAGRGIVHSERTPAAERAAGQRMHGIQTWVALPQADEETTPAFHHHPAATLPSLTLDEGRVRLRVVAGDAFGLRSPVAVFARTLYVAIECDAGARLTIDEEHRERGIHVADGAVAIGGHTLTAGQMLVLPARGTFALHALVPTRLFLFGGDPLDGERFMWWNFVSSSRERIEQAKRDWSEGRFDQVPGETEFIPLPDR